MPELHPLARAYLEQVRACLLELAPEHLIGPKLAAWMEAGCPIDIDPREVVDA